MLIEWVASNTSILLIALVIASVLIVAFFLLRDYQTMPTNSQMETKIRVLVVDSDPNARDTLVKFLRFEKSLVIVGEAPTGQAAIEQAVQLKPAVVLLDLSLSDMQGLAVVQSIARQVPGIRFVFTRESSFSEPADWPAVLSAPLVKPVDYRKLIEALRRAERFVGAI
jgi:DNA-binding NarL/FixJ family response regulator